MALKTKLGISQYTTQQEEDKTVYKITLFQTKATPKFCYAANILYKINRQDFLNCLSQKVDIIYVHSETNNTCIIQSAISRTIHPKHVKEDDLQKLFGYHLSPCLVGRNKDVLIKILSTYIYNYALERWTKLEAKASRNRIIEIDKNFIYDAVHTSFLLKKKIPLSFHSLSGIKNWHDSVAIEYRNKNLPKVLIPKQSVFNDLQLPSNCVRLISKNMFAEEGLVQNNCVAFYIERVNKDQCSIWSMRKEDGTRNTIEIRLRKVKKHPKGIFVLAQMKGFNNSNSPKEDIEQIKKALKEINSGR